MPEQRVVVEGSRETRPRAQHILDCFGREPLHRPPFAHLETDDTTIHLVGDRVPDRLTEHYLGHGDGFQESTEREEHSMAQR